MPVYTVLAADAAAVPVQHPAITLVGPDGAPYNPATGIPSGTYAQAAAEAGRIYAETYGFSTSASAAANATALNNAAIASKAVGKILTCLTPGVYNMALDVVTIDCDCEFAPGVLMWCAVAGNGGTAIKLGTVNVTTRNKNMVLPDVRLAAIDWATNVNAVQRGVEVVGGLESCIIKFQRISNFAEGFAVRPSGVGAAYNTVHLGWLADNKANVTIQPLGAAGFANESLWLGGRLSHSGGVTGEQSHRPGVYQIDIRPPSGSSNVVNGHRFLGTSLEGWIPEVSIQCAGWYNEFHCRWEAPARIVSVDVGAGASAANTSVVGATLKATTFDIGESISIPGAGTAGGTHVATVTAWASANELTISPPVVTPVTNAGATVAASPWVRWGTASQLAFNNTIRDGADAWKIRTQQGHASSYNNTIHHPTDTITRGYLVRGAIQSFESGVAGSLPYATGDWYGIPCQSVGAFNFGDQTAHFSRLQVGRRASFDRIACNVTVAGSAGALIRLGVYADNGAGRPGTLVLDAGTVNATAIGVLSQTIVLTLDPGVYWLVAAIQGGAGTTPTVTYVGSADSSLALTTASTFFTAPQLGFSQVISGTLPATAAVSGNTTVPMRVGLRAA